MTKYYIDYIVTGGASLIKNNIFFRINNLVTRETINIEMEFDINTTLEEVINYVFAETNIDKNNYNIILRIQNSKTLSSVDFHKTLSDYNIQNNDIFVLELNPKITIDKEGVYILETLFNFMIDSHNPNKQTIISLMSKVIEPNHHIKNITQQFQPQIIDMSKDEIQIILIDRDFHKLEFPPFDFFDLLSLVEEPFEVIDSNKIRNFTKEMGRPLELNKIPSYYDSIGFESESYLKILDSLNLTNKKLTWYVINYSITSDAQVKDILKKTCVEKGIEESDIVNYFNYCSFEGDCYSQPWREINSELN